MHINACTLSNIEVQAALSTGEGGLSADEAVKRLQEYGYNELREAPRRGVIYMFFSQFASFMILVLMAAALIAFFLGKWIDAAAIGTILVLNAILGTTQEYRAERAIEALRKMVVQETRVMRDGKEQKIPARELVPGDAIIIEAGDRIPADARLLEAVMLEVNEASLTGESTPVKKEAEKVLPESSALSSRTNMVFAGTAVINGRGRAFVAATGMRTEFGKIAQVVQETGVEKTPLKQNLERFGRHLAIIVIIGAAILFIFGILRGIPYFEMFMTSVSLAVAVIPEGLPAVITIALALGVKRMSDRNAIVRKLLAVETLGSTNVILTDKTGTLTKNEMTVTKIYSSCNFIEVTGSGYEAKGEFLENGNKAQLHGNPELKMLLHICALCNNSNIVYDNEKKTWNAIGDTTDAALLVLALKASLKRDELKKTVRFISELPFSPERKMMTVVYEKNGETLALTKGAPESVLLRCKWISINGKEEMLSAEDKENILEAQKLMSANALRVLGFAYRKLAGIKNFSAEQVEQELTFIGLAGAMDAPREEVPEAIELCRRAGIEVVMATGDNEVTAQAVASKIDLIRKNDLIITGKELDEMKDGELEERIEHVRVFARVAPEHKLRIVKAWKAKGKIIAVTGDGINDAPALKHADIGIAMGITGTDVAKEVSQMTLTDDNFASIAKAVEEGRGIYENIRKCLFFIFPANIAEVLVIFFSILLGLPLPLTAIQILWVNLVTETIPAFALASDPIDRRLMHMPPRKRNESIWKGSRAFILDYSVILAIFSLFIFWEFLKSGDVMKAQTMVFTVIVISGVFRAFSCRSLTSPVTGIKIFENRWLVFTVVLIFFLQLAVVSLPFFGDVLSTVPLNIMEWTIVVAVCASCFVYLEVYKAVMK